MARGEAAEKKEKGGDLKDRQANDDIDRDHEFDEFDRVTEVQ